MYIEPAFVTGKRSLGVFWQREPIAESNGGSVALGPGISTLFARFGLDVACMK